MSRWLAQVIQPEILELIEAGDWATLREFLAEQPAVDIVDLLDAVGPADRLLLFRLLPRNLAGEVFERLDTDHQNALIQQMAQDEARATLTRMSPDDRTAMLEELPAPAVQRLLELLPDAQRRDAMALLNYPERSVGRLMTPACVRIRADWTCREVVDHLRRHGSDSETMAMLYVVDEQGRLVDDIRLRQVILADPDTPVRSLMDGRFAALGVRQDRAEAVAAFRKYGLFALPVVDAAGALLGIVTHDDILQVEEQESTQDFHRLGTVEPLETRFREATVPLLVRRRSGWLLGLVAMNIISGAAIAAFEDMIAASVALVLFLPLLIDSGGNAGSQSATLVVRALATGDVRAADWWRLAGRELLTSLMLGGTMAGAVALLGLWRGGTDLAAVVALAMAAVVVFGSLLGLALPFLLLRCRADPAAASVPLVTSLADISGVVIYFSIARALIPH